jgi:DNA-directed RNA polymerase specialized sigma24 family protein
VRELTDIDPLTNYIQIDPYEEEWSRQCSGYFKHVLYLRGFRIYWVVSVTKGDPHLVQDCLERAVCHFSQFRAGTNLRAWLLTIIRNCFLDERWREQGRIEVSLDSLPYEWARSPARQEHNIILIQELHQAFLLLPEE